jgi:hypothetical protein
VIVSTWKKGSGATLRVVNASLTVDTADGITPEEARGQPSSNSFTRISALWTAVCANLNAKILVDAVRQSQQHTLPRAEHGRGTESRTKIRYLLFPSGAATHLHTITYVYERVQSAS